MKLRQKILLICGSINQTTQMHQIARELSECEHAFTPYYVDGWLELCRRAGLLEFTVAGNNLRRRCEDYLSRNGLPVDPHGRSEDYDLVLSCSDLVVPGNLKKKRVVLVQEGILDPIGLPFHLCRRLSVLPRWLAGTATTGLSLAYEKFCVASEGYRDLFISHGIPADRIVVTGTPNFDDCRRYEDNDFPYRGFVLVCSSDARETFKRDNRAAFLRHCVEIAAGRQLIFKLHPNENVGRAFREIREHAPGALIYTTGSAEQMIAKCEVLITQWSSTAFVGLALGKEVHSYHDREELRRLLPIQNGRAARNIAAVCRELLETPQEAPVTVPTNPLTAWFPAFLPWRAR